MYRVPISFHDRLMRGEIPVAYVMINTHLGYRAYAEKELTETFDVLGYIADGTYSAGGSILAGGDSVGVIDKSGRVLDFGYFERTLNPAKYDILTAFQKKQQQHISIVLDNTDRYFSKLIAKEPFLSREISVYLGFESESFSGHLQQFYGVISELVVMPQFIIEADER